MEQDKNKRQSYEKLEKRLYEGYGYYGIPKIHPTEFSECEFIGFNYTQSATDKTNKGVHFFLDDYQFVRVWNQPDKYINILSQFRHVMSPDFSMYTDFPLAIQIYKCS